jgi:NAD(P)-dependent dehydrogenase (short-subunit alcohol dehydrogenase family)
MTQLHGTSIIITGAFGALGSATARAAAKAGARLALIDYASSVPKELLNECGPSAIALAGIDLARASDAAAAVDAARERLGALDVLINIAGSFRWAPLGADTVGVWDELFAINLKTAVNACTSAVPHLRKSRCGRIVNLGAYAALKAGKGMGPYSASKGAVHKLTESLAEELKNDGIGVNAVLPSIIDTPANRMEMPKADFSAWVSPDALAEIILFLASAAARPITGALVPVVGRV